MEETLIIPQTPDKLAKSMDFVSNVLNHIFQSVQSIKEGVEKEEKRTKDDFDKAKLAVQSFFNGISNWINITFGPKYRKTQTKLSKVYDKYIFNNKLIDIVIKGFKGLLDASSGWFFKLLKFLFLIAIFDPKGKFLKSILGFILNMVKWFLDLATQYLPDIISTIIDLVVDIFPPLLEQIINTLADSFYNMFYTWAQKFPEESFMRNLLEGIADLFGEEGVLVNFLSKIAEYSPYIVAILGALAAISTISPLFLALKVLLLDIIWPAITLIYGILKLVVVNFVWPIITLIATILGLPAWLVAAIIAAVIALGTIIYIYWEDIKKFVLNVIDKIKERIFALWQTIVKLFDKIKKGFIDNIVNPIMNLKNIATNTWQGVKEKAKETGSKIWDKVLSYLDIIQTTLSLFKNKFSDIWNHIKDFFTSGIGKLLDFIGSIGVGAGEGFKYKDIGSVGTMAIAKVARESEEGTSEIINKLENNIEALKKAAAQEGINVSGKDMRELVLALGEKVGKEKTATIITNIVKPRTLNTSNPNK